MKNKILYLVIGICCIGLTACTHDSDEPTSVIKNEISRSTITVERTVTLTTPGTLQEELEKLIDDVSTLQKLTIIGPYNGKDVQYWRTALNNLIEFDLKDAIPTCTEGENEYLGNSGSIRNQEDNKIGDDSFCNMDKLEAIVFPDCVTTIGSQACYYCSNLKTVTFGNNVENLDINAFAFSGLSYIEIPSTVTSIGSQLFWGCSELKSVKFLANITSITNSMFSGCSKLETIDLSSSIKEIDSHAFYGCTSLKSFPFSQIIKLNNSSFHGSGLEEVDLSNVTDFSNASWCFRLCESLKKVILPDNVTSLANTMFWGCISLEEVNIPSSLETINDELFGGCALTELRIPSTVKYIGNNAFTQNESLKSVTLSEGLETIGSDAFSYTAIESIILPNSVTSFGERCFDYCRELSSITLSSQIKVIPMYAFGNCKALKTIELPNGLETIGLGCFGESGLETIQIPSSVTTIEDHAFRQSQLKNIHIPETVITVNGDIFWECQHLQYLIWDSPAELVNTSAVGSSCMVYLANENIVYGADWKNVAVNDGVEYVVESMSLCEGGQRDNQNRSYSIPIPMKVKKISYERRFGDVDWDGTYWTYPGECSGWQTIVLPFTPTKIEHETKGEIAPFNSGIEGAKPFWLRELTAEGFVDKTIIEPNKPYIIAMPNHDSYMDEFRLYGKIIFSAENVILESTIDETTNEDKVYDASVGPEYDLQPTYNYVKHGPLIYALNVTYRINNHHYGSLFARSSSDVYAFEAYVKPGGRLARSAYGIDTSSSNTRSAKEKNTTGIPQIGDM